MALDIEKLGKDMFTAAFAVLKQKAPEIEAYARSEFRKIAETLATIESEKLAGRISDEQALLLFEMQKSATRSVLLTSSGLSLLAAEAAINAALDVVKVAVNAAIGIVLI